MPSQARQQSEGSEIERKFLVVGTPPVTGACGRAVAQGYLAIADRDGAPLEIRIRRIEPDKFFLSFKSSGGQTRAEIELPLTAEQFDQLWPYTESYRLEKKRFLIELSDSLRAELDEYEGALHGLRVVEVEFPSVASAEAFVPPAWFGAEITEDPDYRNANLALRAAGEERNGETAKRRDGD
ncbi:MAG: CYTH domain-containing protein [Verrucomicrobia bacterium]|nr:CYTH domain-containing protein [Verrucomicrobiota bacterium]